MTNLNILNITSTDYVYIYVYNKLSRNIRFIKTIETLVNYDINNVNVNISSIRH